MIDTSERQRLIEDNRRLVGAWIRHRVDRLLLQKCGGFHELQADLWEPYVKAVDYWLASDRSYTLGTFVFKCCNGFFARHLFLSRLIAITPIDNNDSPATRDRKWALFRAPIVSLSEFHDMDRVPAKSLAIQPEEIESPSFAMKEAIGSLNHVEQYVIRARYGFLGKMFTLDQIGCVLNVTRERVRQLQLRAMNKLRQSKHMMRAFRDAEP